MTTPAGFPPTPPGGANQNAIIAAAPGDPLGEALATVFRGLGWRALVTDQPARYAPDARVCVAIISVATINSPAVAAALATPLVPLVPLTLGGMPPPPGPWSTAPVPFTGSPEQAARAIVAALPPFSSFPTMPGSPSTPMPPIPPISGATLGAPPTATGAFAGVAPPFSAAPAAPTLGGTTPMPGAPAPYGQYGQPGQYGQYGQYAAQPSAPQPAPRPYTTPVAPRRRRLGWIIGAVVAALLLICAAVGLAAYPRIVTAVHASQTATALARATATPRPAPTPPLPPGFTRYTDTVGGFSIAYPLLWQAQGGSGEVTLVGVQDGADMTVGSAQVTLSPSDIISAETVFFKSVSQSGTVSNLQGPTTVTYAGIPWTKESAEVQIAGQTDIATALVANHGSRAYIIGYLAPQQTFPTIDQTTFQPMLGTLMFLG